MALRIKLGLIRCLISLLLPTMSFAVSKTDSTDSIKPGAIELGVSGSLTAIENVTDAVLILRSGWFFPAMKGLSNVEIDLGYSHLRSLDIFEMQVQVGWQRKLSDSPVYPFILIGSGLRQEWLGSFRKTLFPVGANLGLRILLSNFSAIRLEYKIRRILNDPISDFTEHHLLLGISLFLNN